MARRPPRAPCLPTVELERLAQSYQVTSQAWRSSPLIATVTDRLSRLERAARVHAEAFGALRPAELELLGIDGASAHAKLQDLDASAHACRSALDDLDARGGGNGGARRLAALFASPPKFVLALSVRAALVHAGSGRPMRREIVDLMADVLAMVGEEPSGLVDVVKGLPDLGGKPDI